MKTFLSVFRNIWRAGTKSRRRVAATIVLLAAITGISLFAYAYQGDGANLWDHLSYRLDRHYGAVANGLPNTAEYNSGNNLPWYGDEDCTTRVGKYGLGAGVWVNPYPPNAGKAGQGTTAALTVEQDTPRSQSYVTHFIRQSDFKYIVSGTGHFTGADWSDSAWYNSLPGNPGYVGKLTQDTGLDNGDLIYIGKNVGNFKLIDDPIFDENFNMVTGYYWQLRDGNDNPVMKKTDQPSAFCRYNQYDFINADYGWVRTYTTSWTSDGLVQGTNKISLAGTDASGNYLLGYKTIKWDTRAPVLSDTINDIAHNGWINKALVDNGRTFTISGTDNTAYSTDVSGVHASSLQFAYDGGGYSGYTYTSDPGGVTGTTAYTGAYASLVNQVGQGAHSVSYSMFDWAGNTSARSEQVKIDTVAPTITATPVTGQFNSTRDGIALSLSYSDATSGMDASTEYYQWVQHDGSPTDSGWQKYTGQTVTQTQKGVWNLYFKGSDNAGNASAGHSGPYYCGSLAGYIQNPGTDYVNGQDVIASVYVKSSDSGDITPANGASVTLVAKDANGNVLTTQTKDLVVPNSETQLVWYKFHVPDDAIGPINLTATINSSLADAQHNPFYLSVNNSLGGGADFLDMQDDPIPDWVNTNMAAPVSTDTSSSWQEWSYANGTFAHNTYTASATASLKITADPDSPPPVKTDPTTGRVSMPSGYPIVAKPSVTVKTDESLDAVTGAQSVFARYPEWSYNYDHSNLMTLLSSSSDTANKTITGKFNLPENRYFSIGGYDDILDKITERCFHLTPGKFYEKNSTYTALITAQDIWTPAGPIEASTTDYVTLYQFIDNDWSPEQTNKQMLGY